MNRSGYKVERRLLHLLHGRKTRTHLTEIHAYFLRRNLDHSNLLLSHFVSVCGSFHKMMYAQMIFAYTRNPSILLFNSMIKGYSLAGPFEDSFSLFFSMRNRGILPDEFTFPSLLKSCSNLHNLGLGRTIHAQVLKIGYERHSSVTIGLVEVYTSCKTMEDAKKIFDQMPNRDPIVWNMMIHGFCEEGDIDSGYHFFRQMGEPNIVSWNSMISGFAKDGRYIKAIEIFQEMMNCDCKPDDATIVTILPVCARIGNSDIGRCIHSYAHVSGLLKEYVSVGNSLIDMYCKCGDLKCARELFDEMPNRDVVSWNSLIMGMALTGHGTDGLSFFEEMKKQSIKPNDVTFIAVLECCSHAGLIEQGEQLFHSISIDYDIEPNMEHYGCMVDLFGRFGLVKEAYGLIRKMNTRPTAAIWGSLLNASRIHGDLEIAEYSAKELINMEPWNSGNFVLLSNIYAEAERWGDVEKIRLLMKEKGILKFPGQSIVSGEMYK